MRPRTAALLTSAGTFVVAFALTTKPAAAHDYYYIGPPAYSYYGPPVYYEPLIDPVIVAPVTVIVRRPIVPFHGPPFYEAPVYHRYSRWHRPRSREHKYRVYTPFGVHKYEIEFERDGDIEFKHRFDD